MLERLVNEVLSWVVASLGAVAFLGTLVAMCKTYDLLVNMVMF